jgi:hypothetical protein
VTIHERAVNVGCHVAMKHETDTFLKQEKDASPSATTIRMLCALALSASIENLQRIKSAGEQQRDSKCHFRFRCKLDKTYLSTNETDSRLVTVWTKHAKRGIQIRVRGSQCRYSRMRTSSSMFGPSYSVPTKQLNRFL